MSISVAPHSIRENSRPIRHCPRRAARSRQGQRIKNVMVQHGTLCNLTCENCYIESSPRNNRLAYLTTSEVAEYLEEIEREGLGTELIGYTGGEPFMNLSLPPMLDEALSRGFRVLVLTNAMKPIHKKAALLSLRERYGDRLTIRSRSTITVEKSTSGSAGKEAGRQLSRAPMARRKRVLTQCRQPISVGRVRSCAARGFRPTVRGARRLT
jgi:uncharacterized radical SAM superfamily Fe-S cluster-containing enzyme